MSFVRRNLGSLCLLAVVSVLAQGSACLAGDHLKLGVSSYNSGQYLNGLHELMAAVHENPDSATAHYYLANCLSFLGQHDAASEEYKTAYSLAPPHSQMANYCMQALTGDQQASPQQQQDAVRQMVSTIRSQVDSKEQILQDESRARAYDAMSNGNAQSMAIQNRANQALNDIANNPMVIRNGRGHVQHIPRYGDMEAVRQQAEYDTANAQMNSQRAAAEATNDGGRRLVNIEDAASDLESQFLHPSSGVHLNPVGTNLYVQNYSPAEDAPPPAYPSQSYPPQSLPPPAGTKAKQLVLKNGRPYFIKGPLASTSGGRQTTTNVHGQMLNP